MDKINAAVVAAAVVFSVQVAVVGLVERLATPVGLGELAELLLLAAQETPETPERQQHIIASL